MAKNQVVIYSYTCDVCGDQIPGGEGATRKLSWEGTEYVLDACVTHATELEGVLGRLKGFVDAGQRSTGRRGRRPAVAAATATRAPRTRKATASTPTPSSAPKRGDVSAIRAWARASGHKVSERGRIPAALVTAYEAASNGSGAAPEPEVAEAPAAATKAPATKATRKRRPRKAAVTSE